MRFSGGGGSSRNCSSTQKAYAILWRGGVVSAKFFFSVTSKRNFPLMGPFFIFLLSRRGGPGPPGPPPESATVDGYLNPVSVCEILYRDTEPTFHH